MFDPLRRTIATAMIAGVLAVGFLGPAVTPARADFSCNVHAWGGWLSPTSAYGSGWLSCTGTVNYSTQTLRLGRCWYDVGGACLGWNDVAAVMCAERVNGPGAYYIPLNPASNCSQGNLLAGNIYHLTNYTDTYDIDGFHRGGHYTTQQWRQPG